MDTAITAYKIIASIITVLVAVFVLTNIEKDDNKIDLLIDFTVLILSVAILVAIWG